MSNYSPNSAEQSCSTFSRAVGEPIIGSAPKTESWILLEVDEPPGANALMDSSLPQTVKQYLTAIQTKLPSPRILLIRSKSPAPQPGYAFYLAAAGEEDPRLYEFSLENYEDILAMDIVAILRADPAYRGHLRQEPLFVICTNGRRDPCCAKWGVATYNALADQNEIKTWQSSHLGGHRFAANLVYLPYGIYYGHIAPEQVSRLVADALSHRITLENYRGRASYPSVVQIAEYYLRAETGNLSLDGFRLDSSRETGPDQWETKFTSTSDGKPYILNLAGELTGDTIFESCSTPDDRKPVKRFKVSVMSS
jgi:hypothetical protein